MKHSGTTLKHMTGRIQGLDALRGIAIGLVLLRHAWPGIFGGAGIVGVVMFFALSGYLITGLLVGDVRKHGRVRFGRFYWHRALRLVPPLLFMLAGFLIVTLTIDPASEHGTELRSVLVAMTYTMDIPFNHGAVSISHLWTLAIEEQFYLVWPFVIIVGLRLGWLRWFVAVVGVVIYLACLGSLMVKSPADVYTWPTSWAVVMVIGAAARLGEDRILAVLGSIERRRVVAAAGLVTLLALSFVPDVKEWAGSYLLLGPVIGAATIAMIMYARDFPRVGRAAVPLVRLGAISYAAYLWNYPIVIWLASGDTPVGWEAVASLPLTIVAATVSLILVERPIARWRSRMDARRTVSATV